MHLCAVKAEFRIAVCETVNRLIFLEAVAFEAQPFGELFDLRDEDEVDVLLAEVAFALRAVNRAIFRGIDELENELSLALRTLENLGYHNRYLLN